ncbi:MAG: hypothetical protein HUU49_02915 [Candidatus Buchananbacteria bacterium]|nr:hypothetical protein [Candidatus Buchananbacteria bacterium]
MYETELKTIAQSVASGENPNQLVDQIEGLSQQLVFDLEILQSYKLSKIIDELQAKNYEKISPRNIDRLNLANVRLKFTSLPRWSDNVVTSLFEKDIAKVLADDDIGLFDRLNAFLIQLPITDRDKFKQRLLNHLRDNTELISNQKIVVDGEEKSATVANIITDYFKNKGVRATDLDFAEYTMKNKNYLKMSEADRLKVKNLLKLLFRLTTSSMTPEGVENDLVFIDADGQIKAIENGTIINLTNTNTGRKSPLPEKIKTISENDFILPSESAGPAIDTNPTDVNPVVVENSTVQTTQVQEEIVAAYRGDVKMASAIDKEMEKISKKIGDNNQQLRSEFMVAVQNKNIIRTVALLRILAQADDLEKFVVEDEKLNKFLLVTWEKQYGADFALEFKTTPAQPKFIRTFLRYILEQRLNMPANEAARVGQKIGNIFVSLGKKSYNKMAYFDVNSKTFNWFE